MDIAGATIGLLVFGPVCVVIATIMRIQDGGPVLYRGRRVGRWGVPFEMLKFRTMVVNADRLGGPSTSGDDPRVTPIGRWLRRYKLDELPQLLNVLRGEMSFVGPRPEVQQYVDLFTAEERAILSVRPGITDWASLWNSDEGALLAGSADPERVYLEEIRPKKLRLQLAYVREQSLATDLLILGRTVAAVVSRRPAAAVLEREGAESH
jgi:lipopolysaccharide/colanic/teichoic acid biosynthesis glycosyltransferase